MKKLLITSKLSKKEIDLVRKELEGLYKIITPSTYDREGFLNEIEDVEVVLGNYIDRELIEKSKVKLVQNPFAGVENFDFDLLREKNIILCNSHSNADAVAEHTLALILSMLRNIPYHDKLLRKGDWNRHMDEESLFSESLFNKKIGILGYGNIGKSIARLLTIFNPELYIIVRDKNKLDDGVKFIGDSTSLDYVMSKVDILILALPLTEKTKAMINSTNLSRMKENSYIVNVSRGEIIKEEDFYNLLRTRKIAGAAIDSWYNYPKDFKDKTNPSSYNFSDLTNVVMSPHRAPFIRGELTNIYEAIENLRSYYKFGNVKNKINLNEGY